MEDSQLTLITLPHEILWQILKIHFSGVTIGIRNEGDVPGSFPNRRGRRRVLPKRHGSPESIDIFLSCQVLHRISKQAMFEFAEIELGDHAEYLIQELSPSIPLREFRRIALPLLESKQLKRWLWEELQEIQVVDVVSVFYDDQEDVTSQCEKLKETLDFCKSHGIVVTADLTFTVDGYPECDPRDCWADHEMRFVIDAKYKLSLLSMTYMSEEQFDILQFALKETFNFVFPKPKWTESQFTDDFTLKFPLALTQGENSIPDN